MGIRPQPLPASAFSSRPKPAFQSLTDSAFDASPFDLLLADFTARWERGESARLDDFLNQVGPDESSERIELIYREFCLARRAGMQPRPEDYTARFPAHAEALERLFQVDDVFGSSGLRLWSEPLPPVPLPEVGHEIGPFRFIRELGQGGFARVFLAEQSNLDDRLVVVKVSSRITPEHCLLARSNHPHIVDVYRQDLTDDGALQIICMPFQGGASLAAVLSECRQRGARTGSGRELLDALDLVSADGYLPPTAGRPCRALISRLSFPEAAAWIVARLAEALDYAYGRGVLHGDIKPSNVLLTADGTPKLLDFNLSLDWHQFVAVPCAKGLPGNAGGTLAYMAPELLRTVADPARISHPTPSDRHRGDIYSLGVLLLEILAGRPPELPEGRPLSLQELASAYVSSREQSGAVVIRSARAPLAAGLRSILSRCLAPDPVDRYKRASELAEDLDHWLDARPLVFAREPARAFGLLRWARHQRLALAAFACGLAVAAVSTALVWYSAGIDRRELAIRKCLQIFGDPDIGGIHFRRPQLGWVKTRGNPAEIAKRRLDWYDVLGPSGNWRERDDFRDLPASMQDELEVWLLEQSLRYAHGLSESPDSQPRALVSLEKITASSPFGALQEECARLRRQLKQPGLSLAESDIPQPDVASRRWMDEYLYGVAAELRGETNELLEESLEHYRTAVALRPNSFWANYRAAATACALNKYNQRITAYTIKNYSLAVNYLRVCVDQRPENSALRCLLAGCLYQVHRDLEAAEQCDKAQSLDPDLAETYVTRSFLRIRGGQFQTFIKDIGLYDALIGSPRPPVLGSMPLDIARSASEVEGDGGRMELSYASDVVADLDEPFVRNHLARTLSDAGKHEFALKQFEHVLEMNPDNLRARYGRAVQLNMLGRVEADEGICLGCPASSKLETLIREDPEAIRFSLYRDVIIPTWQVFRRRLMLPRMVCGLPTDVRSNRSSRTTLLPVFMPSPRKTIPRWSDTP